MTYCVFVKPLMAALNAPAATVLSYFTFSTLASVVTLAFGSQILKIGVGKAVAIFSIVGGLFYVLLAIFPSVPMLFAAAIVGGFVYPIASLFTIPILINKWFSKNTGTWIGVALACTGFGTAVLAPVATDIIARSGWQTAMIALGVLLAVVQLILAASVLRMSPIPYGILPQGATEDDVKKMLVGQAEGKKDVANVPGLMLKEATRSSAFLIVILAMFLFGVIGCFSQNINTLVQVSGYTPVVAAFALSCSAIGNVIGKIGVGVVKDKVGAFVAGCLGFGVTIIGFALYVVGIFSISEILIYIAAFITGCGVTSSLMFQALLPGAAFGNKDYATIYGVLAAVSGVGAAVAAPVAGMIFDNTGSYLISMVLWIVAAVVVIPCIGVGIRLGQKKWMKAPQGVITEEST